MRGNKCFICISTHEIFNSVSGLGTNACLESDLVPLFFLKIYYESSSAFVPTFSVIIENFQRLGTYN